VALLGKWIWRLGSKKGGLWKEVIESKYDGWRSLREDKSSYTESLWWRDLIGVWRMEEWGRYFEGCLEWIISNGNNILFRDDVWLGSEALKSRFPRLLYLSISNEACLDSFGEWTSNSWNWALKWRRGLFDWEKDQEFQLMQKLQSSRLVLGKEVNWVWKDEADSGYSICSAYSILKKSCISKSSSLFEDFWNIKALPFALFRFLGNSIASKVNLVRRGVIVDCSSCCLCRDEVETTRHLFFECIYSLVSLESVLCLAWDDVGRSF